jgi:hypothetical protein
MENNIQTREFPSRGDATPAQINEVLELLGSKLLDENQELPAGLVRGLMYQAILTGVDVRPYTTKEELSDIIQELRALPDRQSNRAEDAAMLADVASVEAERNNNADASQEFGTLADGANVVASQPASEDSGTTPEAPSAPEAPATETPVTPEAPRGAVPESMNGTQILDPQWLSDAPIGTRVYSTSTGRGYERVSGDTWNQVVNGEVVSGGNSNTDLLSQRISGGTLYVGSTPPATLPPGSQTSAAGDRNLYPQIPSQPSGITPDVSAGWADVPAETQINNPDWFSGAPVGTQVTLANVDYEKKDDGKWYPTSGDFVSTGYTSGDLGRTGLLSRADQGQDKNDVPYVWELLPEGSTISDANYITSAPIGSAVMLQLSDGSSPLKFVRLGNGKWELDSTRKQFTDEQLTYRFRNSGANTFTALPSEDTTPVSTTVSSLDELRGFPTGTVLNGATPAGHYRRFSRGADGKWAVQSRHGSTNRWTDAQVMQAIRRGTVVYNGNNANRFAPTYQATNGGRGATPARTGNRRPNSKAPQPTYTPGTYETDVTPEQFREIIRSSSSRELQRLLLQHLEGKVFGRFRLGDFSFGGRSFTAQIFDENGRNVGHTTRTFKLDDNGNVYVYNNWMEINARGNRGNGFSTNFTEAMYDFYRKLGIQKVMVGAGLSDGGYTWGRAGFDFKNGEVPSDIVSNIRSELSQAISEGRMQDVMHLNNLLQRILRGGDERPTAFEIATVPGQLEFYPGQGGTLGRDLMGGTGWGGVRSIPTLEESLAFMEAAQRAYEKSQRQQNPNGWNS